MLAGSSSGAAQLSTTIQQTSRFQRRRTVSSSSDIRRGCYTGVADGDVALYALFQCVAHRPPVCMPVAGSDVRICLSETHIAVVVTGTYV